MSAYTRCLWTKLKTLSRKNDKWECAVCGEKATTKKGEKPSECEMMREYRK